MTAEFGGNSTKRLVLVDGNAIIHRAYHALPPLTTPYGQPAQAAYGFVSMLLRVIEDLKPTHLAVCFDLPVATFRHEAYIAYQANRPQADDELIDQIQMVHDVVEASGIPIYSSPGFEADDVIGTLAEQAVGLRTTVYGLQHDNEAVDSRRKTVDEVVIVTGDRDIMQLVNDQVKVYAPVRGFANAQVFGKKEVEEYVGVEPQKIVDYKALTGDPSDNYPGVVGIGPKTAQMLLEKFGTLEEIYKNLEGTLPLRGRRLEDGGWKIEGIPDGVLEKLKNGKDSALLSQHLAQIATHAPVELDLEKAKLKSLKDNPKFMEKLKELGFKSLIARIGGVAEQSQTKSAIMSKSKTEEKEENKDQMELI